MSFPKLPLKLPVQSPKRPLEFQIYQIDPDQ